MSTNVQSSVDRARVLPSSAINKVPWWNKPAYEDLNVCPSPQPCTSLVLPLICVNQSKITFACDFFGPDRSTPAVMLSEKSLLLPNWQGRFLWGGDCSHPIFLLINNELVLAGVWSNVLVCGYVNIFCGLVTDSINSAIYNLDMQYLGRSTGYTVSPVDLSAFPNL
jgi:hypothetical protein